MNNIIDPRKFKDKDLPLIVMVDDRRSWFGFLIKSHSGGNYNHIMCLHREGYFASQDPKGYREVPIENYIKPYITMKFWSYSKMTIEQKKKWIGVIRVDLNAKKRFMDYDWLGLIGQFLHIRWLQDQGRKYCSEREAEHLRFALDFNIPKHPTPSEINNVFISMPDMKIKGYYISD